MFSFVMFGLTSKQSGHLCRTCVLSSAVVIDPMMKLWCLKFHRWIALLFSLPLVIVLVPGPILSTEPWLVVRSTKPGSITAEKVHAVLDKYDAKAQARAISYRAYDNALSIGGRA